jgi:two-component system chemotaxis response regulator CheY
VVRGRKQPSRHNDLKETRDPIKILVVEDDPDLGDTLCDTLAMSGYRAAYAADGIAALELLRNGADLPDLILLDLMLPRMDGWGFREAQLGDKRLKDIPVVVLSAAGEIVKPINADYLLRKPVTSEMLLATIERFRQHSRV